MTAIEITHRVIRSLAAARAGLAEARNATGKKNVEVIADTVDTNLPKVVETLLTLGFSGEKKGLKSYRLPFLPETLEQLSEASAKTGVPAAHLFNVCLASLASPNAEKAAPSPAKATKGRRGAKAAPVATKAAKTAGKKPAAKPATKAGKLTARKTTKGGR